MSRLTLDGKAEPVSRDQILKRVRGQENSHFLCPADHEQDWQPYPVDSHSAMDVMTIVWISLAWGQLMLLSDVQCGSAHHTFSEEA